MAIPIIIDLLLDNSPGNEIRNQHNESNQPRHGRDERRAQGSEDGSTQRGEEGEEGKTACDGVQDHDAGECVGGVLGCRAVVAGAEGVEEGDGGVADAGVCAGVSGVTGRGVSCLHVVWGGRCGLGEIAEVIERVKRF